MKLMIIGAATGFAVGATLGGGAFGLPGLLGFGALGALLGGATLPGIARASAGEYSRHTHMVQCPETGETFPVTLTPESAMRAAEGEGCPEVANCPRWKTRGRCSGPCAKQLEP